MSITDNIHPFNRCYTLMVLISIVSIFAIWSRYLTAQYQQTKGILEEIKRVESSLKFNIRNQNLRMAISQEKEGITTTTKDGGKVERFQTINPYETTTIDNDYYIDDNDVNDDETKITKSTTTKRNEPTTKEYLVKLRTTEIVQPTTSEVNDYNNDNDENDVENTENTNPTTTKHIKFITMKELLELTATEVIDSTKITTIEDDIVYDYGDKSSSSDENDNFTEITELVTTVLTTMALTEPPIEKLKYILIWTRPHHDPLMYLGEGQETFIKKKCPVQNCHISLMKKGTALLKDITEFDAILFNGPDIVNKKKPVLPDRRDPKQNYVYASIESSDYYPMCDGKFDGYFNISWTYKLDSDISYGYMIARNMDGEIVAPKKETHWISVDDMKPINLTVKEKLSTKKKLASWMVSNCRSPSGRDQFVKKIQDHVEKLGGNWTVDIYGKCGTIPCDKKDTSKCLSMFETDYYFYFAFENSFAEDYVTEKILHPLQHYTVPVVYGAANYTRFLPDGIYLNALDLGPEKVAEKMVEIAEDKEKYYEYFKWKNHYTFHYMEESQETDFHCLFCAAMNNEELMSRPTVIEDFKNWWNPPKIRRGGCPPRY